MDMTFSPEDEAFREEVRTFMAEKLPPEIREASIRSHSYVPKEYTRRWHKILFEQGWVAPSWPKEHGGCEWSPVQKHIYDEEYQNAHAPRLSSFGITMIGPVLYTFGTEAQKQQHIPSILNGDIFWCQGYSEPGSGSDLASLQTRAVLDASRENYVVNGQKIWTSGADKADRMLCLVRTDPDASKHDGISFILFDMRTEGVTVKPILLISGKTPNSETFLDNVRVPKENLVHERGKGWTVGKRLLQYERSSIGGIGGGQRTKTIEDYALDYVGKDSLGRIDDAMLRSSVLDHRMNDAAFGLTSRRAMEESSTGLAPGALSSMFKYYGTEQNKGKFELLLSILGVQSLGWEGESFDADEINTTRAWLRSKANSIEGGTSEVQLNIIAKRILGLPD